MLNEVDDKTLITITPEWMAEKFDEMNKLLFNGILPKCKLTLFTTGKGSQGRTLGWFKVRPSWQVKHKWVPYSREGSGYQYYIDGEDSMEPMDFEYYMNPEIQLNGNYNWTEKAALSTLVHEMCHYRQHVFGFFAATRQKFIHHGPDFMRIAEQVSLKSNEFFTVERIAKAEQMEQMDFTDAMKEKFNRAASKGIKFFKIQFSAPETGRRTGKVFNYGYIIPPQNKADDYIRYYESNPASNIARLILCVTTDGNIKRYHRVNNIGAYYYTTSDSIEGVLPDVKVDYQREIIASGKEMKSPWYLFRMKYNQPYTSSRLKETYKYAYRIVATNGWYDAKEDILNSRDKFSYADWCEIYDGAILRHKPNKGTSNYLTNNFDNILTDVRKGEFNVLYNDEITNADFRLDSLASFLYGNTGNPHLQYAQQKAAQQPKRYTFTMKVMSQGVPTTFTINNATEEEAKQQMKQRFPKWSDEVIDAKFKTYAANSVNETIYIKEDDVKIMVKEALQQYIKRRTV